ncbi:murein biosynthesis integral membrane protein MurJ [Rathayibacter iranicus]|uniref:Murein biosynthesis integral membrane protein MurJ n=2 Tax=Rathayibacter iranicus TaxID=59737 RepID=A0AAD1ENK2_9MICO|nr:murein biosynthesis integral membrane protein MurJ [Rathayibacter iranicus]MWV31889.1 murein biosynthesis integral membrane protein MurJ [Rathayibacter iranicus NCPPB 2253 = VKM Ac-1602]PPI43486.1 murein biosynthesis integral membrane protein MurJ [Rathayibacter iranicus]PPI58749.1 murein biosynthesis integral membrane protein MurJ [Rathayibacter iranicus]PPI69695.1 murein biosynthesis integral membrane protein MurJ [Rathayibacter iranicus]
MTERTRVASFSLGRASAILASGTMVSRVLGFIMSIVFTQTVGLVGQGADAFTIANGLPNTIYSIIAGGALNAVLVPQIVRAGLHADGGRAYINRLLTLSFLLLLVAAVAATLLAPVLVQLNASDYGPTQFRLAVAFAYWCLPQVFFYGLYTILGEVLNARGSFGPFTWTPVVNNVVTIAGLVAFQSLFGVDSFDLRFASAWTPEMVAVLAGSATLGVALQAILLVFFWKRLGLSYRPDFRLRGVGLGRAGRIAVWTFAALLLTVAAGFVENSTVSGSSGDYASATALQKAWLIFMLPHSVIAVSVATAYFTRMSGHAAAGRIDAFRADVSASIRIVGLFLVFAAVALVVCAIPFAVVFSDDFEAIAPMAAIITAYVVVLPLFSTLAIVQRAFYSLDDGRTPFFYTLVQTAIVVIGCQIALLGPPEATAFIVASSVSLGVAVQATLACLLLRRRLGGRGGQAIVRRFAQYTFAALPTGAVGGVVMLVLFEQDAFPVAGMASAIISMAIAGTIMAVVYFAILWFLRVPELRTLAAPFLRRLGR